MKKKNYTIKTEPYQSMIKTENQLPENTIKMIGGGVQVSDRMIYLFAKASGLKSKKTRIIKKRGKQLLLAALMTAADKR